MNLSPEALFAALFAAKDEDDVHALVTANSKIFKTENWKPLGGNFSNYGVVWRAHVN